ncbi:DUF1206 domain-containing protein [Frankia sp. CNm7]|uniref:DUF1206 domain-containing protein n=1 Tax=Frankia nepalensis TaxID=1836974 RepID=A0A937RIE7_9ACTN|nr:DUF1206 domain-containing protein [Frankia nepalensis]MBL7499096.1 DUF1206 domain-containing protein [Frankia nepalensis]MBL7511442.1 DUF1206 domain-containing protein [Frankia nepalensis]MBL7517043.1 DUF1206 domain-containing protein [Frankia nepalensis]MBL7629545.1 DUF1206 domain-containing protein [Frankia nepalensis]
MSVNSTSGPGAAVASGRGHAQRARRSTAVTATARLGLASRGLVYLLIGMLAIQVAAGRSQESTNREGALRQIADKPFGTAVLVLLVIGFIGYALWRLLNAATGETEESDGKKRAAKRASSAVRGVIYLVIAGSTIKFLTSGSGGSGEPAPYTARVMDNTGGRWLVGVVGVVVIGVGLAMIWRGVTTKFEEKLRTGEMGPKVRTATVRTGQVGYVARGTVFGLAGYFVTKAAVDFDPSEAKGLDGTLKTIAQASYGPWLLGICAVGLVLFGAYSFLEARYRKL